jgi:hypothetical protein
MAAALAAVIRREVLRIIGLNGLSALMTGAHRNQ